MKPSEATMEAAGRLSMIQLWWYSYIVCGGDPVVVVHLERGYIVRPEGGIWLHPSSMANMGNMAYDYYDYDLATVYTHTKGPRSPEVLRAEDVA